MASLREEEREIYNFLRENLKKNKDRIVALRAWEIVKSIEKDWQYRFSPIFFQYCISLSWDAFHTIYQRAEGEERQEAEDCLFICAQKCQWNLPRLAEELRNPRESLRQHVELFIKMVAFLHKDDANVEITCMRMAIALGDRALAEHHFEAWKNRLRVDKKGDQAFFGEQYRLQSGILFFSFIGKPRQASEIAKELLQNKIKHPTPPALFAKIIRNYGEINHWQEALHLLNSWHKHITKDPVFFAHEFIELILLKIEWGARDEAHDLLDKYLKILKRSCENSFYYTAMLRFILSVFDKKEYEKARRIAKDYDKRNGNPMFSQRLERLLQTIYFH